jgi:hypothetical protein
MSLEQVEKLLVGMMPPEALNPVHSQFELMRENPVEAFSGLWNHLFPTLRDPEDAGHVAAINGILVGVSLYYGLQRSANLQKIIGDYIVDRSRKRGENIVNFYEARAGRKPC